MRLFVSLLLSAAVLAGWLPGASNGLADAPSPQQYLSLGDSLALSMQPDVHGDDRATTHGFSEWVRRNRSSSYQRSLTLVKLGRGGETSASMIHSPRPGPSQLELAEDRLRTGAVAFVTVDIGANEVERCATGTGFDGDCVQRGLASLRRSLPLIIERLRAAGGASLEIVGINYYNSFLGRWVTGPAGQRLAQASVPVERSINATLAQIYTRFGIPVADVESRFQTGALDRWVSGRYGRVPLAVANTCRWTWACSARYDDHTNAAGYRVIARTVLALLRSA